MHAFALDFLVVLNQLCYRGFMPWKELRLSSLVKGMNPCHRLPPFVLNSHVVHKDATFHVVFHFFTKKLLAGPLTILNLACRTRNALSTSLRYADCLVVNSFSYGFVRRAMPFTNVAQSG